MKHVPRYLLVIGLFVAMPFVLYFAAILLSYATYTPSLHPHSTPSPSPDSITNLGTLIEYRNTNRAETVDDAGSNSWLQRQDNGIYGVVANLNWVADGVDKIEIDPVTVLMELSLEDPGTAIRFLEMPWFNDGLTEDEAWAFLGFIYIDSFAADAAAETNQLPWVVDGINEFEARAITSLPRIFDESADAGKTLISCPWFRDGITSQESKAIELLESLSYKNASASKFISMSFMESIEEADVLALDALYQLALLNMNTLTTPSEFEAFISHPNIKDGITDEETVYVTLASDVYDLNPELSYKLLDPTENMLESRTINLPMSGEVELVVVRTQQGSARSLDFLERSVRFSENYMGEPFPAGLIILLYADATQIEFSGRNSRTNIVVHSDFDRDDGSIKAEQSEFLIMHEVAHFYWHSSLYSWLDEGAAEFLSIIYAENVTGIALIDLLTTEFLSDFNCDGVNNLKSLEALTGSQSVDCAYDLGLLFFLDLHHVLGAEDFQRGFQGLYLANEDVLEHDGASVRGVRHVREAFKFSTIATEVVIPRWLEVQGTSQD